MSLVLDRHRDAITAMRNVQCLATCWKIARTDGVVMRFTDHDAPLELNEDLGLLYSVLSSSHTYRPATGFSASAREEAAQLEIPNFDVFGVLQTGAITDADLHAGRYDDATVTEYLVDWRWPWAGPLETAKFMLQKIRYTGEIWKSEIVGRSQKLRQRAGRIYARKCPYDLGDADCGYVFTGTDIAKRVRVLSIGTQRLKFRATTLITPNSNFTDGPPTGSDPGWYTFGKLTWTVGKNKGIVSQVRVHDNVSSTPLAADFELYLETPFDISVWDECEIQPGCNKFDGNIVPTGHCKGKFNNILNHGGQPFIPGNDRMLQGV